MSFFVVCDNPVHRVMVNWDPPPISQVIHLPGGIQKGITYIQYVMGFVMFGVGEVQYKPH